MLEEIRKFMGQVSCKYKDRRATEIACEHFRNMGHECSLTSSGRYLKIDGVEYRIRMDLDAVNWDVQEMRWLSHVQG